MSIPNNKILKRFKDAQDALVLQASDLSLETIANMVDSEAIDVSPTYQRRERWDTQKQRALIESFLLNVPVPPVYLFEEEYGSYSVIDGKQRIISIHRFMRGLLELKELENFTEVNGRSIDSLPTGIQNAFKVRPYIRIVTLLRQSKEELKYEVFRRLNEGGLPLNPQEIRNVVFRGPLNALIYELSETPFLLRQMKIKNKREPSYRQMVNAEVVLRFLVLRTSWKAFSEAFRDSMDDYMKANQTLNDLELGALRSDFVRALRGCERIFGEAAFRRPGVGGWRDQFLMSMYDAQMIAVAEANDTIIHRGSEHSKEIVNNLRRRFEHDKEFEASVREATNTAGRIRYRVEQVSELLRSSRITHA
jgi:hypothetical protein